MKTAPTAGRHRRAQGRLLPGPPGRPALTRLRLREGLREPQGQHQGPADHLRPHRHARPATRAWSCSTGSSTTSTSSTTCTRATGRGCRSPSTRTRRPRRSRTAPHRSPSSSMPEASGLTGTTPRSRRRTRTRSSIRRRARTPPSTTTRSTSRTARTARGSAATTPPSRSRARSPRAIIVPTHAAARERIPVAQLSGPLGPAGEGVQQRPDRARSPRGQWLEPFTWMEGIRQDSPRLPGGTILGPAASTAFCGAMAGVSEFINLEAKDDPRRDRPRRGPDAADRHAAAVHPLASGRHLRTAAQVELRPAAARRAPALRPSLADDAALRPDRLRDARGDPGASVPVPQVEDGSKDFTMGIHPAGSTSVRRFVRRIRRADRLGVRLRGRRRVHAAARERRAGRDTRIASGRSTSGSGGSSSGSCSRPPAGAR